MTCRRAYLERLSLDCCSQEVRAPLSLFIFVIPTGAKCIRAVIKGRGLLNCLRTGEQYTVGDYDWVTRYRVHSKTETWGSKGGYLLRLEDGYIVSSYFYSCLILTP